MSLAYIYLWIGGFVSNLCGVVGLIQQYQGIILFRYRNQRHYFYLNCRGLGPTLIPASSFSIWEMSSESKFILEA